MPEESHTTPDEGLGLIVGLERVRRLRIAMADEISRREKELLALRGKLSGVEMVIAMCADEEC